MLLSTALAVLSVLSAAVAPVDARNSSSARSLHRRKCKASSGGGGAINVGNVTTTSSPDDAPHTTTTASKGSSTGKSSSGGSSSGCFPSANFDTPDSPSGTSLGDWWCSRKSEYAWLGFSYDVTGCQSKSSMTSDFKQMKSQYGARYARIYSACDRDGFYDDVVGAAYTAGIGVYALVWFGFDGTDIWKTRMNAIVSTVKNNELAPYVIRNIVFGSESLFDHDISVSDMIKNINSIKASVANTDIEVTTSDMAYILQNEDSLLNVMDHVELSDLPFFANDATTGSAAGDSFMSSLTTMAQSTNNHKKVIAVETGWPSNENVWKANAASAVASVNSEQQYYQVLDGLCETLKKGPAGGYAWFAHIWEDNTLSGWGIVKNGQPKFDFSARTSC